MPTTTEAACATDVFVVPLEDVTGVVAFSNSMNAYVVKTSVAGTYDCQILGLLCGAYEHLNEKTITYSAKFYEYHGAMEPVLFAGQKLFVLKNLTYRLN